MRTHPTASRKSTTGSRRGFALVITLSLMVLLTLLAVGLLTLSSVTLRASAQGEAMAVARSNARLAMMLALGELQKYAGPDRVVTAPSDILREGPGKPNLTGVWESWNYQPDASNLDYPGEKNSRFRHWLVSNASPKEAADRDFVTEPFQRDAIVLAGANSFGGPDTPPKDQRQYLTAGRVPIAHKGQATGAFAWQVADESVKARINSYRDPDQNQTLWQKRALLAGHRPNPSVVSDQTGNKLTFLPTDDDTKKFSRAVEYSGKLASLQQADLLAESRRIARFRSHVTPYSFGVPVNVRDGGLKQDLSTLFAFSPTELPTAYNKRQLYASTHKITGPTDPYWSTLKSYHDIYKETTLSTAAPFYYKVSTEDSPLTKITPPTKFYPAPVIDKAEILFSIVVRTSHGPWSAASTGMTENTRMVHLLYAPIITLHNPYNVSLKFDQLDLDIKGIPMAFNFTVNDQPQNSEPVSLNEMFVVGADRLEKSFFISISNWSDYTSNSPSPITMKPGQTLVCGPYINGDAIFGERGYEGSAVFFDYGNDLTGTATARAKCKPGFLGRQVSYDVDWLTLGEHASGFSTDGNRGTLIVKPNDRFFVEWKVKANTGVIPDKFTVNAKLTVQGTSRELGGLEFDYDAANSVLYKSYPTTYRYPDIKSVPNSLVVEELWEPNDKKLRDQTKAQSFAIFSAYARTTNGGVYDHTTRDKLATGRNLQPDGRLAGLPFLHHSPARNSTVVDLKTDLPGRFSHEMNAQPLARIVDDFLNIDSTNRGYSLTGHKTNRGIKSGSYLELPTGPMQTLADFRRSNALTCPQLPQFAQPISNSHSSPLIATNKVVQTGTVRYALLDHSVLANHALYDRFYFSTFSTYGTTAIEKVFTDFMSRTKPLAAQAFEPYLPPGKTVEAAKTELFSGGRANATAYQTAAEYQLVRSPFNVNSTDVQAWQAVLASLNPSIVQTLWAVTGLQAEWKSDYFPILPMSLINGGKVGGYTNNQLPNIDNRLTNDWNGYRELMPDQIETLATRIVEEVRKRGPFLSLSEFVNRRIGGDSELTRVGALQAAIDQSKLNDNYLTGYVTDVRAADIADSKVYGFANPTADLGNPAAGAPGWLMQGDLMRLLEPGATVRGDTFVIRTCGEAVDAKGKVTARAYAEAVVQRVPDYLNSIDRPSTNVWDPANSSASLENKAFGRRFNLVAFRWLAPSEI